MSGVIENYGSDDREGGEVSNEGRPNVVKNYQTDKRKGGDVSTEGVTECIKVLRERREEGRCEHWRGDRVLDFYENGEWGVKTGEEWAKRDNELVMI